MRWTEMLFVFTVHAIAVLGLAIGYTTVNSIILFFVLFLLCGSFGVQVGMHRFFAHNSFKTWRWVEYSLAWIVTLNHQGSVRRWVELHRIHHRHADTEFDVHSPRHGFLWAHVGWIFRDGRHDSSAEDCRIRYASAAHRMIERFAIFSSFCVGLACYAIDGAPGVIWGIFVRMVAVYHVTWFINSASHKWGYRNFDTVDHSRNLWWTAIFTLGEWHNNHHRFPSCARSGIRWFEIDPAWRIIQFMWLCGLVWDIHDLPGKPEQLLSNEVDN